MCQRYLYPAIQNFLMVGICLEAKKKILFLVAKSERIKHLVNCNSSLERGTKSFKKRKIRSGVANVGIRSEEGPSFPCSLLQRVLADISLRGKGRS